MTINRVEMFGKCLSVVPVPSPLPCRRLRGRGRGWGNFPLSTIPTQKRKNVVTSVRTYYAYPKERLPIPVLCLPMG